MELFKIDHKKNKADGKKVGEILAEIHKAQLLETVKTKDQALKFLKDNFGQ